MMLANSSIAIFGLIDAAVVGHLENEAYLAGVALASVLFDFLYWGVTFLRMGTTGIVSQDYGSKNISRCQQSLFEGVATALVIAAVILVLHQPLMNFGLSLLSGSDAAVEQAEVYFGLKIWGAPGVLMSMVIMGWLIGMQQATAVLKLTVVTSLLNAGLDLILVFGFDLGIQGVAYAALISSYFAAMWGAVLCFRVLSTLGASKVMQLPKVERMKRFLSLNFNIFIRTLCLIAAFSLFTRAGAQQGDTVLAANALLLSLQMLLALALDGYANALEVLVGESIGERNERGLMDSIAVGTFWSLLGACVFSITYYFFGGQLLGLLTDIPAVHGTALQYLPWLVLSPLIAVWCFVFDGVFIGATQGKAMRDSMIFALFAIFIPALWLAKGHGNHGLWAAFMLFFAARGASMIVLFFRLNDRGVFIQASD